MVALDACCCFYWYRQHCLATSSVTNTTSASAAIAAAAASTHACLLIVPISLGLISTARIGTALASVRTMAMTRFFSFLQLQLSTALAAFQLVRQGVGMAPLITVPFVGAVS